MTGAAAGPGGRRRRTGRAGPTRPARSGRPGPAAGRRPGPTSLQWTPRPGRARSTRSVPVGSAWTSAPGAPTSTVTVALDQVRPVAGALVVVTRTATGAPPYFATSRGVRSQPSDTVRAVRTGRVAVERTRMRSRIPSGVARRARSTRMVGSLIGSPRVRATATNRVRPGPSGNRGEVVRRQPVEREPGRREHPDVGHEEPVHVGAVDLAVLARERDRGREHGRDQLVGRRRRPPRLRYLSLLHHCRCSTVDIHGHRPPNSGPTLDRTLEAGSMSNHHS